MSKAKKAVVKTKAKLKPARVGKVGSKHPNAKLTPAKVRTIRKQLVKGTTLSALARQAGVTPLVIRRIRDGVSYKDVL